MPSLETSFETFFGGLRPLSLMFLYGYDGAKKMKPDLNNEMLRQIILVETPKRLIPDVL